MATKKDNVSIKNKKRGSSLKDAGDFPQAMALIWQRSPLFEILSPPGRPLVNDFNDLVQAFRQTMVSAQSSLFEKLVVAFAIKGDWRLFEERIQKQGGIQTPEAVTFLADLLGGRVKRARGTPPTYAGLIRSMLRAIMVVTAQEDLGRTAAIGWVAEWTGVDDRTIQRDLEENEQAVRKAVLASADSRGWATLNRHLVSRR